MSGCMAEARQPVLVVTRELGLDGDARRGVPCPACRAPRRDARRLPAGLTADGMGWRCHRCNAGGDSLEYMALALFGRRARDLGPHDRGVLRARSVGASAVAPPVQGFTSLGPVLDEVLPTLGRRPPREEVQGLWDRCRPLASLSDSRSAFDAPARSYLETRGFLRMACEIADADLARITPPPAVGGWPAWWPPGRAWTWRLVVRAYEADGTLASLHGRATCTPRQGLPKTLWPGPGAAGERHTAGRLLFACPAAQRVLRGDASEVHTILVCEGLTDWLAAAADCAVHRREGWAVLGGTSGSFPALAGVRWGPNPIRFVALVDGDAAGDRYFAQIRSALPGRDLRRVRFGSEQVA